MKENFSESKNTNKNETQENAQEDILDFESFDKFRKENGFDDGRRGTLFSKEKNLYLYIKSCFELKDEKQARESLKVIKHLTGLGIFQPDTKFGIYQNKTGGYQIFPIMPKLEEWDLEKNNKDGRKNVLNTGRAETSDSILSDGSHIKEWMQRIPGNEKISNEIEPNKDNLVNLLNIYEASNRSNWGWDKEGKLYPIDVEVVSLNDDYSQDIIKKWIQQNS